MVQVKVVVVMGMVGWEVAVRERAVRAVGAGTGVHRGGMAGLATDYRAGAEVVTWEVEGLHAGHTAGRELQARRRTACA